MKNNIKKLLREASEEKIVEGTPEASSSQYQRVSALLKNNIFNHAEIVEKLWGDKEASNRSKFRKKLEREQNEAGKTHMFSDEEVTKIGNILMDTSTDIRKKLGKKDAKK